MRHADYIANKAAQHYFEGLEKKRQRNMGWFLDEFLPSVATRIGNNPAYPNSCVVSEKQADVLWFYMDRYYDEARIIGNDGKTYALEQRGKWSVLVRLGRV